MRKLLSILALSALVYSCSGQINRSKSYSVENNQSDKTEVKIVLDSIISIVKTHSIYKDDVDWSKLEQGVYNKFINSDSIVSIIEPTQYLLGELGDHHGFLVLNGKQYWTKKEKKRNANYDNNSTSYKEKHGKIISQLIDEKEINAKIIHDSIAYLEIPFFVNNKGIDSVNLNYTIQLRKAICELSKNNPRGYIIDLRRNLGGTVFPMISGMGELFKDLDLGGTTKDNIDYDTKWMLRDGNFYFGETSLSSIPEIECDISISDCPIVVLIGRYTGSSGEIIAAALKGQRNIKLIGEQTAGYTTTNSWFYIAENISIHPSISFYMSEDRTAHTDGVFPDIEVNESLNLENLLSGEVMKKAIYHINTIYDRVHKSQY